MNCFDWARLGPPLLCCILGGGMGLSHCAQAALGLPDADKQFTTLDIVQRTAQQIPDCIDYCVVGMCVHLQFTFPPPGVKVLLSPKIEHYLPDFVVQSYKEVAEEPWMEWSKVFGAAEKEAQSSIMQLMGGGLGLVGGHDVGEGEYAHGDRETFFKESDVIGHPLTLLPKIMRKNGSMKASTEMDGNLGSVAQQGSNGTMESGDQWCNWEEGWCDDGFTDEGSSCGPDCHDNDITVDQAYHEGEMAADDYLDNFGSGSGLFMNTDLTRIFNVVDSVNEVTEQFETVNELMEMVDQISQITDAVGVGAGAEFRIEDILCDTPVLPFVPYYLSAMDSFFWRNGWPLTDIEKAVHVLNPFSSEAIKSEENDPLLPLPHEWGNLYPRHGFLQQYHDKKAASVMAARAVDVAVEAGGHRIRFSPPRTGRWTDGKWSELHPDPGKACHSTVAYDMDVVDSSSETEAGHYAWSYWRKYDCCMNQTGVFVEVIPLPKSCVI